MAAKVMVLANIDDFHWDLQVVASQHHMVVSDYVDSLSISQGIRSNSQAKYQAWCKEKNLQPEEGIGLLYKDTFLRYCKVIGLDPAKYIKKEFQEEPAVHKAPQSSMTQELEKQTALLVEIRDLLKELAK